MSEPIAEFYGDIDELISTTEILYLIGDDNCQFNTIVRILEPEKSINIDKKLIHIAIDLNIPGGTIAHWRRGINFGNLSNDVLLYELLKEFRSKYASEATLYKFVDALHKKDLFQEAERLGAHFGIDLELDKAFVQSRTNKDNWAKLGCVSTTLLTLLIVGFTCTFPFLGKHENKFQGCPITSMINEELYNTTTMWARHIQVRNFSEIYDILHRCDVSNKTTLLLSDSVDAAYHGNIYNFHAVLNFVRGIFSPIYQFIGYSTLLTSMNSYAQDYTTQMFKLVYFIKTAMNNQTHGSELHTKYVNLTYLVVEDIRAIMFRKCVFIVNQSFGEYLYLSNESTSDSQLLVMTKPGRMYRNFTEVWWFFETVYEDDHIFFLIQKQYQPDSSSICPSTNLYEVHSKKTVECDEHDKVDPSWVVEPGRMDRQFMIKRPDGCALYSPNSLKRYAVVWSGDCKRTPENYIWNIHDIDYI